MPTAQTDRLATMLEKMAAAIEQSYSRQQADEPVDWLDCARAALEAIREPDEAMMKEGMTAVLTRSAHTTFTAMIDSILSEGEKP